MLIGKEFYIDNFITKKKKLYNLKIYQSVYVKK